MDRRTCLLARLMVPVIGLFAAAGIAATTPVAPALADNIVPATTGDQEFDFGFRNFGHERRTAVASKDDASASYINVDNMTIYDVHLFVDGYDGSFNTNLTRGGYAYLIDPGQWWIHQYVYENGYRWAALRGLSSEAGVLGGQWSPDSWGVYNSLN